MHKNSLLDALAGAQIRSARIIRSRCFPHDKAAPAAYTGPFSYSILSFSLATTTCLALCNVCIFAIRRDIAF